MSTGLKIAGGVLALLVALLALPILFPGKQVAPPPETDMPWQIEQPGPGQTRVFGLTLGGSTGSTMADAQLKFPATPARLALLAPMNSPLALEAYFDNITLGALTGKLVVSIDLPPTELDAIRSRSPKTEFMASGTRIYELSAGDRTRVTTLPLAGINLIPAASLDEAIILQRFGNPAERIRQGETLEHFLYPDKGLDVVLDSKGKEVLQYVAPSQFARLREPLGK
jgi:hypothetical protein